MRAEMGAQVPGGTIPPESIQKKGAIEHCLARKTGRMAARSAAVNAALFLVALGSLAPPGCPG
jgi:hypothetical protein